MVDLEGIKKRLEILAVPDRVWRHDIRALVAEVERLQKLTTVNDMGFVRLLDDHEGEEEKNLKLELENERLREALEWYKDIREALKEG